MRGGTLIALLLLLPITATAAGLSRAEYLMGTVCEITAESAGEAQLSDAFAEARRIERLISTWRQESELSQLNRSGEKRLSAEIVNLLQRAMDVAGRTDGAFNPLVGPLIDAWKTRAEGELPSDAVIRSALERTALNNIEFRGSGVVRLRNGAQIEEGAFGKGYAIDAMLRRIPGGRVVINFGGQLFVRGEAEVSVADPEQRDVAVVTFTVRNASLSTSSGSEKTFVVAGRRITHLIDPRSGQALPPRGSVSVIAADALTADALSTALYVMGPDEGLRWADAHRVAALFITTEHHIRTSAEFRGRTGNVVVVDDHFTAKD